MKGLQLVGRDIKAMWKHRRGKVALIFLCIVPLIYSGFFLAGYWNPYGRLDHLPVAVVNLDQGVVKDGAAIEAGRDFTDELKKNKELDFRFVSKSAADQGLKDGKYYMVVTVPQDFSQHVGTLLGEKPEPANLLYTINPGKNYVAAQISSTAIEKMKTKVANGITKSYADGVLSKFQEVAKGFEEAGDGADRLGAGTNDAKEGAARLSEGIGKLDAGVQGVKAGSDTLLEKQPQLTQGAARVTAGTEQLEAGTEQLAAGAQTLGNGMNELAERTQAWTAGSEKQLQEQTQLASDAAAMDKQLQAYMASHPEARQEAAFQQIAAMSASLASGADQLQSSEKELAQGARNVSAEQARLASGITQLGGKLNEAAAGAKQLADGATQLQGGVEAWGNGFTVLHTGITKLASGGAALSDGTASLTSGLGRLTDGTAQLSDQLHAAAQQTAAVRSDDASSAMFAEPVRLVETKLSHVPNYGVGIAPYFLSLAFYVGGIMSANILSLGKRQDMQVSGTTHVINKLGLVYTIGLIQAFIVDAVILFGFHMKVASVPLFILSSITVSFTFMTFIFMLITLFGFVGKFAAVTLLVLQLSTSGGTFPGELNAPILREIGQMLPMAHSLRGLQDVITLGDWSQLRVQLFILLGYLLGAATIAWIASYLQHKPARQ
ncbi:YhgE/Pip domain-containing protein [Ectobacillus sp. JY-23]|uniref:YhgE/Pip domain-containing protein n=1 Tax=Ectobacillus sp. JY-23 TaxID=2933872 RepID=UPI001FF50B37|nr:YhgE/Pip domain-containing protein [Ectobacillus sp. JY-23]UOY92366.1 YhgE/Pip domain-containing protein [Ectobacillus sp. JY-23]